MGKNIAEVIGWKFNHQPGMSTRSGVITGFPGGIPSQAEQDTWRLEYEAHLSAIDYKGKRRIEYNKRGATIDNMIVALWEKIVEGRPAKADALELIRQQVKVSIK